MISKLEIEFEHFNELSALPEQDQILFHKAKEGLRNSYSPYSDFRVCSIARLADGHLEWTTNQENGVFPLSTCAERGLISYVGTHFKDVPIETIAIIGSSDDKMCTPPCGACRQVMFEMELRQGRDIRILLFSTSGQCWSFSSIKQLLPFAFIFPGS